jgi:hypothetical protein
MGTRSDIIVHCTDGKWRRIYCHWDGYLEHNGRILFDHYTGQKKVEQLIALGDLSSLGQSIGRKHPFDPPRMFAPNVSMDEVSPEYAAYAKRYGKMCKAYGRDRGETDTEPTVGDTLATVWPETDTWTEFTYVWDDGKWWVGDPDEGSQTLIDLGDALLGKKTLKPAVKAFGNVIGQHAKTAPGKDHSWSR